MPATEHKSFHRLILGDAREMPYVPDQSVHLVVTSPPYWNLKRYNETDGQLGHVADYEQFLSDIERVWRECFRVLVSGGRLVCVVGDVCLSRRKYGRHLVMPLHADIVVMCRRIGFDNLNPIIWDKIANANYEVENGSKFLGKPYEPNAIIKNDIEFILMQRKPGGYRQPTEEQRRLSKLSKKEYADWFRQFWTMTGASTRHHPAPFPLELAHRLVRMFSFHGDTVLEPFCGTGTTMLAALKTGRNSIGVDIDPEYCRMALRRLDTESGPLFAQTAIEYRTAHELMAPTAIAVADARVVEGRRRHIVRPRPAKRSPPRNQEVRMPDIHPQLEAAVASARNDIRTDKLDITYGELASMYEAKELVIRPEYQRLFRWNQTQKFRFIESILLGFPTPAIFVAEDASGIWELVDGLQRVSTVLEFMGKLKDAEGNPVPPSTLVKTGRHARLADLDGSRFDDLSLQLRLSIKRAGCRVEVIKVGSQPTMKYDVFERLNTGGSELTPQEVRNCIFRAMQPDFMNWVDELAAFPQFASTLAGMSEHQANTMFDRGLVLRYLAIKNAHAEFDHDVEPFITEYFRDVLSRDRPFVRESEDALFKETFTLISSALGDDAWRHCRNGTHSGPISVYVFETLSTGVARNIEVWKNASHEQLKHRLMEFKQDGRFMENTGAGANTKAKLQRRIDFAEEFFRGQ